VSVWQWAWSYWPHFQVCPVHSIYQWLFLLEVQRLPY
jgi:hypothetical protein